MVGVRTHAECRRNETTGKRGEANEFDPARDASSIRTCEKIGVAGQEARAIALAGSFVRSTGASEPREQ